LVIAVPLSRFTSRVGGGSAFFVRHHGTRAYGTLTAKNSCYRANYSYCLRDSQYVRRIRGFSLRKDKPSFEHGPIRHDYSLWRASSILVLDGGSVYNCIVYVLLGRKRQMARFLEQEVVMPNKSPEPGCRRMAEALRRCSQVAKVSQRLECNILRIQMMNNYQGGPNQSPEPTAVGAVRSAVAVHVASRRWLSFFR
jgi:hypothetical protein